MTNLKDLITLGYIHVGDELEWIRPLKKLKHTAVIGENGLITTSDGAKHKSPSGAARHFYQKPIDGWTAWKLIRNGKSLSDLRKEFTN